MIHAESSASDAHTDVDTDMGSGIFDSGEASAFWFMTSTDDSTDASAYFLKKLGHELDFEQHMASLEELRAAEFTVRSPWLKQMRVSNGTLIR